MPKTSQTQKPEPGKAQSIPALFFQYPDAVCDARENHVHTLEPENHCALTIKAAAIAQATPSGTGWMPGRGGF